MGAGDYGDWSVFDLALWWAIRADNLRAAAHLISTLSKDLISGVDARTRGGYCTHIPGSQMLPHTCRCGGMVDAGDSKSPDGDIVSVRVRPPVPIFFLNKQRIRIFPNRSVRLVKVVGCPYVNNGAFSPQLLGR